MTEAPVHLIQLAGGQGLRAGGGSDAVPKQFRGTGQGPLFAVSLRSFLAGQQAQGYRVASVVVVAADLWKAAVTAAMTELLADHPEIPWLQAPPGKTRTASAWSALSALASGSGGLACPGDRDLVAIHDAARPFATAQLLGRLVAAAGTAEGAIPGIEVKDTVVRVGGGAVEYLQRDSLAAVQTPQVFRWAPCLAAHRWAADQGKDFTDDGGLLTACGHAVVLVQGEPTNWKVTTAMDEDRAQSLLK